MTNNFFLKNKIYLKGQYEINNVCYVPVMNTV